MGIIARQTIKGSIYSYLGAIIGFINVGLIMPQIFSTDEIGLTNLLISVAAIFGQFGSLGFINVTLRLFPYFRNEEKKHNGFLFLLIAIGTLGFLLCAIAYYIMKPYLISENIEKSPLFAEYVYLLIPLIFTMVFYYLIDTYNRILFNASFGLFVKEFLLRILNLIGIGLFYLHVFDFNAFILFYIISYGVPLLLICLLLIYKHQFTIKPAFSFIKPPLLREIISVASFGMISGFSGIVILQIDRYLVNYFCDLSATGVYSTAFFFGTIISLPGRSLIRISSSVIAEAFKNDDNKTVDQIYKKSTMNLLVLGTFIFLIIWGNIDNILKILPPDFADGKYVTLFISLSQLLMMASGTSSEIIQYSKFYKQHTVIMIIFIAAIVGFNILLLPLYGIVGAAIAALISYFIYFILRWFYVKVKFNMQPFGWRHLVVLGFAAVAYFLSILIPFINNVILDAAIRTLFISIAFVLPVYFLHLSDEIDLLVNLVKDKFAKK
jgi:O-antigen/teichoic acid export membrane protein